MNLIGNVTKFTEQGSIELSINWLPQTPHVSNEYFELIPYDDQEGVFEKENNLLRLSEGMKA